MDQKSTGRRSTKLKFFDRHCKFFSEEIIRLMLKILILSLNLHKMGDSPQILHFLIENFPTKLVKWLNAQYYSFS